MDNGKQNETQEFILGNKCKVFSYNYNFAQPLFGICTGKVF